MFLQVGRAECMRIAICVKQVPAASDVKIDKVTKQLRRDRGAAEMNRCDRYALELALRLQEMYSASVTAFTMGPPQARAVLKDCCALGAERAYLLCDAAFAGSDTYATACILAAAIRHDEAAYGKFDLVICGRNSSDGDTAQVGPELAERLDMAQLTGVCAIPEIEGCALIAVVDGGDSVCRMQARLPALLTVGRTPFELRYATISGVIAANRTGDIRTLTLADLPSIDRSEIGLDGSPTRTVSMYSPEKKSEVSFIDGASAAEKAKKLTGLLSRLTSV